MNFQFDRTNGNFASNLRGTNGFDIRKLDRITQLTFRSNHRPKNHVIKEFTIANEPTAHAGHISRISVSRSAIILHDDKTGFYNKEVRTLRKLESPTIEQKEEVARRLDGKSREVPVNLRDDKWHHVKITVNKSVMTVELDDKEIGTLDSPCIDYPTRNRYGFYRCRKKWNTLG